MLPRSWRAGSSTRRASWELVTFLETTYSIRIAEEGEVLLENLDSIERIVVFVRRKIASRDEDRVQGLGPIPLN